MTGSNQQKPELKQMPTLTSIESYSTTTMEGKKVIGQSAGVASNQQDCELINEQA